MTEETVENTEATVAETPMAFDPRSLPEDLANEPSLRNFDDVSKLAKSYVHLVKMRGVPEDQLVKLPSDGNYDEVYNKLGRPADPAELQQNSTLGQILREPTPHAGHASPA